ncbi:unnamed protein product [Amoebophrya sp. A25]|nr:unnamed protein product [Amoebophrya sp. A25]|eukprot:GSA25T00002425001.1
MAAIVFEAISWASNEDSNEPAPVGASGIEKVVATPSSSSAEKNRVGEAPWSDPFKLTIFFDVKEPLTGFVDFKLTFLPCHAGKEELGPDVSEKSMTALIAAASDLEDQILDDVEIGPLLKTGKRKAELIGEPPDFELIPEALHLEMGGIVFTASYKGHEFYRVGWYVAHEYTDDELNEDPEKRPKKIDWTRIRRRIDVKHPIKEQAEIPWEKLNTYKKQAAVSTDEGEREENESDPFNAGNGAPAPKRQKVEDGPVLE